MGSDTGADKSSSGGDDAGLIAGVVIACLVAVCLCCAAGAYLYNKNKQQDWGTTRDASPEPQNAKPVPVSGWAKLVCIVPNKGPKLGIDSRFARPGPRIQAWGLVVTARRRLSPLVACKTIAKVMLLLK